VMGFAVVNAAPDSLAADAAGSAAQTSIGFPGAGVALVPLLAGEDAAGCVDDPGVLDDELQPTSPAADRPRARTPKVSNRTSFKSIWGIKRPSLGRG